MKSSTDFQLKVTEQLMKEANLDSLKLHEKHVALVFNEVHIKDNLVTAYMTNMVLERLAL